MGGLVRVAHVCAGMRREADVLRPRVLLTGRKGCYLALGAPNASGYDGLFIDAPDGSRVKVLADFFPDEEIAAVTLDGISVLREGSSSTQRIFLDAQGMLARCEGTHTLTLDCKRLHDESEEGRIYDVRIREERSGARLVEISYAKHHGNVIAEDNVAYRIHACVATTMDAAFIRKWREEARAYDARRGTRMTPWVYDALALRGSGHVALAVGADADDARKNALALLRSHERIERKEERVPKGLSTEQALAWRALDALRTEKEHEKESGIVAGLPWFGQRWSRDELLSCAGLLAAGAHEEAARILDRWHAAVREDGTLPAIYPGEGLTSADAPGLLGLRTLQLLMVHRASLDRHRLLRWRAGMDKVVRGLHARTRDGLVWNGPCETWMDTAREDSGRAGARIEIQALAIAACDAHRALGEALRERPDEDVRALREGIAHAVRTRLVREGALLDGLFPDGSADPETRPNLFLAWYAAPSLFPPARWEAFFAHALTRLWLPWGALASLSPSSPRFRAMDTGEDSAAYHRGDAWYFMSNIAALALWGTHRARFRPYVAGIASAGMRDLLSQGYAGHASEISSAREQEAMGCHAQAWSAATLLELLVALGDAASPE